MADNRTNTVFIGEKPVMSYVTAVIMQFTQPGVPSVIIKSRGRFISRAVDVAQVALNRFLKDQASHEIRIGSEDFVNKEGKQVRVSTIEIELKKKGD